jgi:hypothetical protein
MLPTSFPGQGLLHHMVPQCVPWDFVIQSSSLHGAALINCRHGSPELMVCPIPIFLQARPSSSLHRLHFWGAGLHDWGAGLHFTGAGLAIRGRLPWAPPNRPHPPMTAGSLEQGREAALPKRLSPSPRRPTPKGMDLGVRTTIPRCPSGSPRSPPSS